MKKILTVLILVVSLTGFTNRNFLHLSPLKSKNVASSILTIRNHHNTATINAVNIQWDEFGNHYSHTVYPNIAPNGSAVVMSGNLTATITVTLTLSTSTSGAMRDWYYDYGDDIYYDMGCQSFSSTTTPSLTFYFYSVNDLYLYYQQTC